MPRIPSLAGLLLVMAVCMLLASSARMGQDMRQQRLPGLFDQAKVESAPNANEAEAAADSNANWFSVEPDGLYHTRRVARLFDDGFPIAASDEKLNYPHGAAIPWPPYYDAVCYALLSPFAPAETQARQQFLEQWVALLPFVFGLLTVALLVYFAAGKQSAAQLITTDNATTKNLPRALLAGIILALNYGAAHYSPPGLGDHHAWVSLWTLLMFGLISAAMRSDVLSNPRRAGLYGLAAGGAAGLLLGSWVASLLSILVVQLALGVLLFRQRKQPQPGLAALGLAFHLAALLVLTPAVMASPWKVEFPWMVVNLSWFHFWHLILGATVFVPLLRQANGGKLHPLALPIGIVGLIALTTATGMGPGAGIREGLAWVSRADEFMSGIAESESLWNAEVFTWVGLGVIVLPFAWLAMLRNAVKHQRAQHWIWLIAIPLFLLQALTQRRFSEALAAPMAWVIAWAVMEWLPRINLARMSAAVAVGFGLNAMVLADLASPFGSKNDADPLHNAYREVYEWIGQQPLLDAQESVLATWDQGHSIEWLTQRGSVATNFGTYVGEDSYRDPARFFLSNDPAAAEDILKQRKTRYVVRTSQLPLALDSLARALQNDEVFVESFTNDRGQKRDRLTPRWFQSMAAILWMPLPPKNPQNPILGTGMGDPDGPSRAKPPIDFLRLVRLSPVPDQDPRHGGMVYPAAAVWEYVPGAKLTAQLKTGQSLQVAMGMTITYNGQGLMSFQYQTKASADADGTVEIRLPYSSEPSGNGGSLFINESHFSILGAGGEVLSTAELSVSEADVLQGRSVSLN